MNDSEQAVGAWGDPVVDALQRSSALISVGRSVEAETVVRRGLAGEPDDPDLRTELARVLLVQGRAEEAIEHADRAVAGAPEDAHAHAIRSLVLGAIPHRGPLAVAAARRAVELEPEQPFAHRTLARALMQADWIDEAQAAVDQAIRLDPEDADGHVLRGSILLRRKRPRDAEAAYREALRLDPQDHEALNNLGVALQAQGTGRGPEAREAFEAAARARPADDVARGNLAIDARSWVNGRWAWGIVVFATVRGLLELSGDADDRTVGAVFLVVALALAAFLLVRGRHRRAALSPATQRLLGEQNWRERTQVTSWRPWFWFVPAPYWLALSALLVVVWGAALVGGTADDAGSMAALFAASVVVLVLSGRRTWQRHGVPWWTRRRG